MSASDIDTLALDRYLAGDASPDVRRVVEQWLEAIPERRAYYETMRHGIISRGAGSARNRDAAREAMLARALQPELVRQRRVLPLGTFHWSIPAFATVMLLLTGMVVKWRESTPSVQRFQTVAGQRATVRLTDGSTVWLAPSTSLVVRSDEIDVIGEAYFTVIPHESRPFTVRVGRASVRVLGTRFNVRRYGDDATTQVMVADGKVLLETHGSTTRSSMTLAAATRAEVTDSGVVVTRGVSVDDYTTWTRGRLVFDGVPLREVLQTLSRAYGAEVRLADSVLARRSMTLAVSVRENSLEDVLSQLALTVNAYVTKQSSSFVIVRGRPLTKEPQIKRISHPEKEYGR
jgi:transmembrane sensor